MPYDWLLLLLGGPSSVGGTLDLIAKFGRLTRIFRLIRLVNHLALARPIRIAMLTVGLSFWTHWVACAWGLIGEIQDGHAFYWLDSLKANMASTCSAQASHDKVAAFVRARHGTTSPGDTYVRRGVWGNHWGTYRETFHRPSCETFETRRSRYLVCLYFAVFTLIAAISAATFSFMLIV